MKNQKRSQSGKAVLIVGLFGLLLVLGTVIVGFIAYEQPPRYYTPQEIATMTQAVNINRASAEELAQLPGMTEEKAQNIVEYREEHGDFASVEELLDVKGFSSVTLDKIRLYITVNE